MPRKAREVKSTAPSPSPAISRSSSRARGKGKQRATEVVEEVEETSASADDHGDAEGDLEEAVEGDAEVVDDDADEDADDAVPDGAADEADGDGDGDGAESSTKLTMAERLAKMKELRQRMNQSTAANRRDLIADHQKAKVSAKEIQRLEKQRKLAQTLRLKTEAEEAGEDMERKKAWEWSIEQNERWEAKMEDQKIRGDSSFHNAEDDAHKLYNRNLRATKPDIAAYARAKEAALGLAPGTLVPGGSSSASTALVASGRGLTAAEDLYRGADTLSYGDSKPSEDAIDRVVGKINKDMSKVKRKKKDDGDDEVNYINDRNKVFNKKIARYYDKYTKEIRANFERGTAL